MVIEKNIRTIFLPFVAISDYNQSSVYYREDNVPITIAVFLSKMKSKLFKDGKTFCFIINSPISYQFHSEVFQETFWHFIVL
jgi:hypothetical protein